VPETEQDITAEFKTFLNDLAGTYTYALTGLQMLRKHTAEGLRRHSPQPTTMLEANSGPLPGNPRGETFHQWAQADLLDNLDQRGLAARQIGHQWLTQVHHGWDDDHYGFRARLAVARGLEKDDVKDPLFGDLNKMRNDVIHHRGIAQARNTGKCEHLHWFAVGDNMFIERRMVWEVMDAFGLTVTAPTGLFREFKAP